jgi:chromosome segregation ATPase
MDMKELVEAVAALGVEKGALEAKCGNLQERLDKASEDAETYRKWWNDECDGRREANKRISELEAKIDELETKAEFAKSIEEDVA